MDFTIYLDVFFIDNFIIDFLLLIVTAICSRRTFKTYRLIIASTIGSLLCVFTYLLDINIISVLLIIPVAVLMIYVAFDYIYTHKFIKTIICFFISSFVFFAVTYLLFSLTPLSSIIIYNGMLIYLNVNFLVLILLMILLITSAKLLTMVYKFDITSTIYKVKVINNLVETEFNALLDTGNLICDTSSGLPIIIAQKNIVSLMLNISSEKLNLIINNKTEENNAGNFSFVYYKSVGNEDKMMTIFVPDKVMIYIKNKFVHVETAIGITNTILSSTNEYMALLSPLNLK